MKQDRFLIGILVFIVVLIVASLVLFFIRQEMPDYVSEDTPQGVVHNYIVAIQKEDYERAYRYLADQENKPSFQSFQRAFLTEPRQRYTLGVRLGKTTQRDENAWVEISMVYSDSGLIPGSGWSQVEKAFLINQNGHWKITYMSYPYWNWDWYQVTPEPVKD